MELALKRPYHIYLYNWKINQAILGSKEKSLKNSIFRSAYFEFSMWVRSPHLNAQTMKNNINKVSVFQRKLVHFVAISFEPYTM